MKIKLATLAIIGTVAAGTLSVLPAEAKGARFDFAPNQYGGEVFRQRHGGAQAPAHAVHHGAMPKGSHFLGVNPAMLQKPAPPPAVQHLQTQVSTPVAQVTPKMLPKQPASFNHAFGKPVTASTPPVVHPPITPPPAPQHAVAKTLPAPAPQPAVAKAAPAPVVAKAPAAAPKVARSTNVQGTIRTRKNSSPTGAVANAGSGIASYGKGFGYVPGAFVPSSGSSGMTVQTNVSGKIVR